MTYTSRQINRDWVKEDGTKLHTLMGVSGVLALIGEEFFEKFLDRAYA